jgi:release factor glutamine methyltransferase
MTDTEQSSDASASALLVKATERLAAAGVPSPRVDAELLLAHVLGVRRSRLLAVSRVHPSAAVALDRLVKRRATREPLQHLLGRAPFRHVEVRVGPGVFVPRPETELLVDAVLPVLRDAAAPVAVDICSGSGALALAIADEVDGARVVAIEKPGPATDWLRRNTAGTGVQVVLGDVTDPELLREFADLRGGVDAVVCNPPYVPAATEVAAEVRFDPADAVFGGDTGLEVVPHVIACAAELLRPGGVLAVEHDDTHGAAAPELLRADGRWREVTDHPDLTGRPRYATAIRT